MHTLQISDLVYEHLKKAASISHHGDINAYLHSRFPVAKEPGQNPDRTVLDRIKEPRYAHCVTPKEKYLVLIALLHEIDNKRFHALHGLTIASRMILSLKEEKIQASHSSAATGRLPGTSFFYLLPARPTDPLDFAVHVLRELDYPSIPVIQEVKKTLRVGIDLAILDF